MITSLNEADNFMKISKDFFELFSFFLLSKVVLKSKEIVLEMCI